MATESTEDRFLLVQGYTIVGCFDTLEEAKLQPLATYLGAKWYIIDTETDSIVAKGTVGTE